MKKSIPDDVSILSFIEKEKNKINSTELIEAEKISLYLKESGISFFWKDIIKALELTSYSDLNRILKTLVLALREEFCDEEGAKKLQAYCAQEKIFIPEKNAFHVFHEKSIVSLLLNNGIKSCFVEDEFENDSVILSVDKLASKGDWFSVVDFWPHKVLADDGSIRFELLYDEHYMLIFLNDKSRFQNQIEHEFEGFWADEETNVLWYMNNRLPV